MNRTFCGIVFRKAGPAQWLSDSGVLLCRNRIGTKLERWSVENHPIDNRLRGTGRNIREALLNSSLIKE